VLALPHFGPFFGNLNVAHDFLVWFGMRFLATFLKKSVLATVLRAQNYLVRIFK